MRIFCFLSLAAVSFAQTPAPKPSGAKPAATKPASAKPAAAKPATPKASAPATATAKTPVPNPNDPVVFRVGDQSMTRSQFDSFLSVLPPELQQQTKTPGGKRQLADKFAEMMALSQEARRRKIDQEATVKQQLSIQTEQILASNLYQSLVRSAKPTDAEAHKYYDEHKNEYEQAHARHILIRFKGSRVPLKAGQEDLTEEQALAKVNEIKKNLAAGGDFATIAKAESDDVGSGANGGDLGTFGRGRMVPQFDAVVFSLPPGELSEPVKTQFGYHIINVIERKAKTFDEARGEIEQRLGPEEARKTVEQIKKNANIMLDDTYFAAK